MLSFVQTCKFFLILAQPIIWPNTCNETIQQKKKKKKLSTKLLIARKFLSLEFSLHKSPHRLDLLPVHLLGNYHVLLMFTALLLNSISLGSSNSPLAIISTFYTLHNFSSILCFPLQSTLSLSLHLINLDNVIHPNPQGPLSSLVQYSLWILCYLFIKFIFGWCSISVWVMGKQWKRRRNVNFISGFFVFPCFISEFFLL